MDKCLPYPDRHPYLSARASLAHASNVVEKSQIQPQRAKNKLSHKGQKTNSATKGKSLLGTSARVARGWQNRQVFPSTSFVGGEKKSR